MLDQGRNYELLVRPRGRTPADEYYHNGAVWIEGREGNNYTVDIRNNTNRRALFIVSIDGLDVIEGQPAGPTSQGYVIGPHETISIPGWKLNNQEAAEFFFSRSRDSYVNAIGGTTTNTGVIGAMIFSEYADPIRQHYYTSALINQGITSTSPSSTPYAQQWTSMLNSPIGTSRSPTITSATVGDTMLQRQSHNTITSSPITQEVGTGFGQATTWQTQATKFRRANPDHPDAMLVMYYNTARNLEKMGIKLRTKRDASYQANPFPGYTTTGCKPPTGWNG